MNYTIVGTLKGFESVHRQGHRVIKFKDQTAKHFANRVNKEKAMHRAPKIEQAPVTPQINPTPVVNVTTSAAALNNVLSDLSLVEARLKKLNIELKKLMYKENPTLEARKALKVKPTTMKGLYRAKQVAPKGEQAVNPMPSNVVEFPKPELPKLDSNVNVAKMDAPQPRQIDITPFQTEVSNKPPYGGAQIFTSPTNVAPNVEKEVKIPNTNNTTVTFDRAPVSDDVAALEELVRKLNDQAGELDKRLIEAKLAYDREQAEAQARKVEYLKAQAALLRKTITNTQMDLAKTESETQRLKATDIGYGEIVEGPRRVA